MSLNIAQYCFQLDPVEEVLLPAQNKGVVLRGAFGKVFKEACCPHWPEWKNRECAGSSLTDPCPVRERCAYSIIFEPAPLPGSDPLSSKQDIPRPFVFKPPLEEKTRYIPDEPIKFDLILAGKSKDFLPYFIVAFKELGGQGLGAKRNGRRGRFRFASVTTPNVIARGKAAGQSISVDGVRDKFVRNISAEVTMKEISERARTLDPRRVTLRFLTPAIIKHEGEIIREPEFHHIARHLKDRIHALASVYGSGPLPWDFKGMGKHAERVKRVKSEFRWMDSTWQSTKERKTGMVHDLSGFVGEATYEGDIREFLPLLLLGEYLHVGQSAAFGLGRYELEKILK